MDIANKYCVACPTTYVVLMPLGTALTQESTNIEVMMCPECGQLYVYADAKDVRKQLSRLRAKVRSYTVKADNSEDLAKVLAVEDVAQADFDDYMHEVLKKYLK